MFFSQNENYGLEIKILRFLRIQPTVTYPNPSRIGLLHTVVDSVFDIDSILLFVLCFLVSRPSLSHHIFRLLMVKPDILKVINFSNDPAMALSVT